MDRMLAGVSRRKYARVGKPIGADVERNGSLLPWCRICDAAERDTRLADGVAGI
jgi:hypothetical protein